MRGFFFFFFSNSEMLNLEVFSSQVGDTIHLFSIIVVCWIHIHIINYKYILYTFFCHKYSTTEDGLTDEQRQFCDWPVRLFLPPMHGKLSGKISVLLANHTIYKGHFEWTGDISVQIFLQVLMGQYWDLATNNTGFLRHPMWQS